MLGQELLGLKIHSKGSAGVPAVRIDEWVERFVSHGCKVVVVAQSDEMEGNNKKRIITEIVSAGTVLEPKVRKSVRKKNVFYLVFSARIRPPDLCLS